MPASMLFKIILLLRGEKAMKQINKLLSVGFVLVFLVVLHSERSVQAATATAVAGAWAQANQVGSPVWEAAINDQDFHVVVSLNQQTYSGTLPGVKDDVLKGRAVKSWYFNCNFFDGATNLLVAATAFPADLLLPEASLAQAQPRIVGFSQRTAPVVFGRKMLTLEWVSEGKFGLFMYELSAEKDRNGAFAPSVDLGKRIPISLNPVDPAYGAWCVGDDIYFKLLKPDGTAMLTQWSATTETLSSVKAEPKAPRPALLVPVLVGNLLQATSDNNSVSLSVDTTAAVDQIDPLAIDEKKITAPYQNYGTKENPVESDDVMSVITSYQLDLGKVLVLDALVEDPNGIVYKVSPSSDDQSVFEESIQDMRDGYKRKKNLLRELKLIFRQYGPKGNLGKWLNSAEVKSIIAALDPEHGGGGVQVLKTAKGNPLNRGRTELINNILTLPLLYYRMLKQKTKAGFNKADWDEYDATTEKKLTHAIQTYAQKKLRVGSDDSSILLNTMKALIALPDQANWSDWFMKTNTDPNLEFLMDYLVTLEDAEIKALCEQAGLTSAIKAKRIILIVQQYKSSTLYFGASVDVIAQADDQANAAPAARVIAKSASSIAKVTPSGDADLPLEAESVQADADTDDDAAPAA
jgi:hypothetical protein